MTNRCIRLGLLIAFLACLPAHAASWREQVRDLLDEGKQQAALHVLERSVSETKQLPDSIEKINRLRQMAAFFCEAGYCERGNGHFQRSMHLSLALPKTWQRLSAAISVLELQQEAIKKPALREALLEQTLAARLLPKAAADPFATEIGRYVGRFDGARRTTLKTLLEQIRHIDASPVRQKALFALSEIGFGADEGDFINMLEQPVAGASVLEKLLWHSALARLFDSPSTMNNSRSHAKRAQLFYESVPESHRQKARNILKAMERAIANRAGG